MLFRLSLRVKSSDRGFTDHGLVITETTKQHLLWTLFKKAILFVVDLIFCMQLCILAWNVQNRMFIINFAVCTKTTLNLIICWLFCYTCSISTRYERWISSTNISDSKTLFSSWSFYSEPAWMVWYRCSPNVTT